MTDRLINLAIVAGLILVGVVIYRIARQLPIRRATSTVAFAYLLILLGFLGWLLSILPVYSLILLLVGVVLLVRRVLDRPRAPATALNSAQA